VFCQCRLRASHAATRCNTLQHTEHTATHCNTLQHTVCFINVGHPTVTLLRPVVSHHLLCGLCKGDPRKSPHIALFLRRCAVWCSMLQHVTACCSVLQCVALCKGDPRKSQRIALFLRRYAVRCSLLQHVTACCIALQRVA